MFINLSITSYFLSICSVLMGLFKMFIYRDGKGLDKAVNAYVGGDAYNYTINASYATAWFVLAVFFAVIGFTFIYLENNKKQEIKEGASN